MHLKNIVRQPGFAKIYVTLSLAILLVTTLLWSLLGAKLQQGNADQLVNTYLLGNSATFHGASYPGQHTFLLKWPLFWLVRLFGSSAGAFTFFTVVTVLVTVGALAVILHRIERRPLVFGTLCLALASVLLLVPAQPYAGGLLPVNMAMLTTRNLEYIVYIGSLGLFIRSPRLRSRGFWLAVLAMALLIASDKLFLTIGLGGALLALVAYARSSNWTMVSWSVNWLITTVAAILGATGILWAINASGLTNISSQVGAGPYGWVQGLHGLVLGILYAIMGLFTNFGANPAFDATEIKNIPERLGTHLFSIGGLTYIINFLILAAGLIMAARLIRNNLTHKKTKRARVEVRSMLSVMLIWSTVAAFGSFIISDHYYAVDARYLTISVFTLFIVAATVGSKRRWQPERVALAGLVIAVGIVLGIPAAVGNYHDQQAGLASVNLRDSVISQALKGHPESILVGDYWRVEPTKLDSGNKLNVMPLAGCTQPQSDLSSQTWQPDLHKTSFAYLLTLDGSLTGYPNCSIKQVTGVYGHPNASTLVAGSLSQPRELLLFYDHGIHKSAPKSASPAKGPATVLPISLDQLPYTSCPVPTTMNIVAHQDDDLLFMNPDIIHDIKAGYCVRTVYITAGDSGGSSFYWLSRERGSEAAYSEMLGSKAIWIERIVELSNHEFVTVANPQDNAKLSLIFMHLPDGNLKGDGFKSSHYESLAKLNAGKISTIQTVDSQSSYTSSQLTAALSVLLHTYQPTEIRTQADYVSTVYPDHSDHITVGAYVKRAYKQYESQQYGNQVTIPIKFYIGYPIHQMAANVSGPDLAVKEAAFLAYAKFDGSVCQSIQQCLSTPTYDSYLTRQYQNPY